MKSIVLGLVAAAAVVAGVPAAAQPNGRGPDRPFDEQQFRDGRGGPNDFRGGDFRGGRGEFRSQFSDDFRRIREDIQRGERSGRINRYEANRLNDDLRAIEIDVRSYMRDDGRMSKTQVKKVQRRLDRLNGAIREAMDRGRGGYR